jgi:hypothetical protein
VVLCRRAVPAIDANFSYRERGFGVTDIIILVLAGLPHVLADPGTAEGRGGSLPVIMHADPKRCFTRYLEGVGDDDADDLAVMPDLLVLQRVVVPPPLICSGGFTSWPMFSKVKISRTPSSDRASTVSKLRMRPRAIALVSRKAWAGAWIGSSDGNSAWPVTLARPSMRVWGAPKGDRGSP